MVVTELLAGADVVQVQGRVSWSEYLRAQYLHLRPRPLLERVGLGIVVVGISVVAVVLWRALRGSPPSHFPYLLVTSLVYLALYFLVFVPWRARALFRRQKVLDGPFRILADSSGLAISSEIGEIRMPWAALRKWKESQRLFLIYHSDSLFHLVPKRLFTTSEQLDAFRGLLHRHLP